MRKHAARLATAIFLPLTLFACGGSDVLLCTPACPVGWQCAASGCVLTNPGGAVDLSVAGGDGGNTCTPACSGLTPYCNASHACAPCLTDDQCPIGQVCETTGQSSACVPGCSSDARCGADMKCCGGACTDVTTDPGNCGACANACGVAHSSASCSGGACQAGACDAGWGDCDMDPKDGCETNLHVDPMNCTACAMTCAFANAVAACSDSCYVAACDFGYDDCDSNAANGCETSVLTDPKNCGACGSVCAAIPNANSACINAACQITGCSTGYADCDGNAANGCEVAIATDAANCGACNNACALGLVCVNGACTCKQCNIPNSKTQCINNQCVFSACLPGFADCNNNQADGCEVNLQTDAKNCAACGTTCPNNLPACVNGACSNAGKCSDVATAYCLAKGWTVSAWNSSFPNQPGGAIFCVKGANAASDCNACDTYNELVWAANAQDACNSKEMLTPGMAYGGHSPCACSPNLLNCGAWPTLGCIPD